MKMLKINEMIELTSELEQLLDCEISIATSCEIMKQNGHKEFEIINRKLSMGKTFPEAVRENKKIFPELFCTAINLGEKTGNLSKLIKFVNYYYKTTGGIKDKLKSALIYPAIVGTLSIILFSFICIFIIPAVTEITSTLENTEAKNLSNVTSSFFLWGIGIIILVVLLVIICYLIKLSGNKNIIVKTKIDKTLLYFPIAGKLISSLEMISTGFSMTALMEAGLTVNESLRETINLISNSAIKNEMTEAAKKMEKGISLSEATASSKIIPKYFKTWTYIAEKSGNPVSAFSHITLHYQKELEKQITIITASIEPAITIATGSAIIIAVFKLIIPIFNIFGNL